MVWIWQNCCHVLLLVSYTYCGVLRGLLRMQPLEACRFGFGTLANIMSPAQEQFIRLRRFLARMEKRGATDDDTDDLYSFFMHAWHLIDWASNDQSIART